MVATMRASYAVGRCKRLVIARRMLIASCIALLPFIAALGSRAEPMPALSSSSKSVAIPQSDSAIGSFISPISDRKSSSHNSARASITIPPAALARRAKLKAVKSWRYQLRRIDINEIAASDDDLLVIDYAPDRVHGVEQPFSQQDVARMQMRPSGKRKLLLAYLSIGEAERYRTYWNNAWYNKPTRPRWLLDVNPQWDGNYPVRFWDRQWQAIVFGSPEAYLDRILAAGFDGVYLDRADVFQDLEKERADSEAEMARFIARLAQHARAKRSDALIVMQNAEELVHLKDVRDAIDGLAKEDFLYGVKHDEAPNPQDMIQSSRSDLAIANRHGIKVLVVEYLAAPALAKRADEHIRALGYLPLIAERSLGTLHFQP